MVDFVWFLVYGNARQSTVVVEELKQSAPLNVGVSSKVKKGVQF